MRPSIARPPCARSTSIPCICLLAAGIAFSFASLTPPSAGADKPDPGEWQVLYLPSKKPVAQTPAPLPDASPIEPIDDLELTGIRPDDPFLLARFRADGRFAVVNQVLRPIGNNAAIRLGRAESFELEGIMDAGGLGGWFLGVGFNEGHGHVIYNVTLKQSGSPWMVAEFRGGKAIAATHYEFTRFVWKGPQRFKLTVVDDELTLKVGSKTVVERLQLTGHDEGDILLGVYNTRYGPKQVQIRSLRIRER